MQIDADQHRCIDAATARWLGFMHLTHRLGMAESAWKQRASASGLTALQR